MKKICKVTVNDEPFLANCGDLLLDWALMNGVDLPHDCRSGICGACKVHLVDGKVFGGQTSNRSPQLARNGSSLTVTLHIFFIIPPRDEWVARALYV